MNRPKMKTNAELAIEREKLEDKNAIISLHKCISPTAEQIGQIYHYYKKYVDPGARPPRVGGCNTCGNSIGNYWRELCKWYNLHKDSF